MSNNAAVTRITVAYLKALRANGVKVPDEAEVSIAVSGTARNAEAERLERLAEQIGEADLAREFKKRARAAREESA